MKNLNNRVFQDLERILRGQTGKNLDIGIITAENKDGRLLSDRENNERTERLYRDLKEIPHIRMYSLQGNSNGVDENSFLVTGVPLKKLEQLASNYEQPSFIYGKGREDDMSFLYMSAMNSGNGHVDYEPQGRRRTFIFKPDARSDYSRYKGIKFVIPFGDSNYAGTTWDELTEEDKGEMSEEQHMEDELSNELSEYPEDINYKKENERMEKSQILRIKNLVESLVVDEKEKVKIKVKHADLLEIPEDKKFWQMPFKHYTDLVDSKGKDGYQKVIRALTNLETWNEKDDPKISREARKLIEKLHQKFRPDEK